MAGEVLALLVTTWHMLMSLLDLVLTVIGGWVTMRWLWRKAATLTAHSKQRSERSAGDGG
jgi:hypothetical protein